MLPPLFFTWGRGKVLRQPKLVVLDLGELPRLYYDTIGSLEGKADLKDAMDLALCFIDDHESADQQVDEMLYAVMDNYADENLGDRILDIVNAHGFVARWFAEEMCGKRLFDYEGPHEFQFDRFIGKRSVAIRLEPLAVKSQSI